MRPLLDRLGIQLPILQAPMAGVSSPAMAAAVTAKGGLGAIAVGAMNADQAREAIDTFNRLSTGPVNINVFVHRTPVADVRIAAKWLQRLAPEFERFGAMPPEALRSPYVSFLDDQAMLALLVEARPRVVSFHFGLPHPAHRPRSAA